MKSSAEMSIIRVCPSATKAPLGVRRACYVKVPAQDRDNAVPYARFQLCTWHERRPLAHWPGQGLGPTAHSLIRTPNPTPQVQTVQGLTPCPPTGARIYPGEHYPSSLPPGPAGLPQEAPSHRLPPDPSSAGARPGRSSRGLRWDRVCRRVPGATYCCRFSPASGNGRPPGHVRYCIPVAEMSSTNRSPKPRSGSAWREGCAAAHVGGDDPHALNLPPGNLRRRLDDLVRRLGRNVAQSADDGLARQTQRALGVPMLFPKLYQFGCCIGCLSQICQKVIDSSGHRSTPSARM